MNSDKMVTTWQDQILVECERIMQRPLTKAETSFVRNRKGFLALEMMEDSVATMARSELLAYLNSDRG
ncbi:hypothetical protein ACHMW6_24100 [Pseudoduganella sp. UC29_106]|uniref:hypothetical protein n=1 Tax=Pseudoduganella sp. UC29_106 TaxID=3374553 RepID=UPI0037580289